MPPQNAGYAYTAYTAAAVIYLSYAVSLWWRRRKLRARLRRTDHE